MQNQSVTLAANIAGDYPLRVATFGENVRRIRAARGMSQGQLADLLGVGQSTASNWETDRRGLPETPTLLRFAKVLGCSVEDLLADVDPEYKPPRTAVSNAAEETFDVSSGYKRDDLPVIREGQASPWSNLAYDDSGRPIWQVEVRMSRPYDVKDPKAYGVQIVGDSMIPMFRPGRKVIVSPNLPVVNGDPVYVELESGERLVKIARRAPGGWLLESINQAYEPRFVKKGEVALMHPVVWARIRE